MSTRGSTAEHLADGRGVTRRDDVEHARRDVGVLGRDLADERGAPRRVGRGLQDHGVAGGERGRDLRQVEHEREVPRRDRADDADRLAHDAPGARHPEELVHGRGRTPTRSGRCSSMSHSMSSMQESCCTAYVSMIGAPTSATICGRSVSCSLAERLLQLLQAPLAELGVGRPVGLVERPPAPRRSARSMSSAPASATWPDDLLGRRVDVVVRSARLRPRRARRRSASGARAASSVMAVPLHRTFGYPSVSRRRLRSIRHADRGARPRLELVPPPRRRRATRRQLHAARPREGDAAPRRRREPRGSHPARAAAEQAIATVRRMRLLADAAERDEDRGKATSAIRTRRQRRRARRPDRGRGRRQGRGDQRPRGGAPDLRRGAAPAWCSSPSPALCFDLGGGSVEIMVGDASGLQVGDEREPRGRPGSPTELVHSDPLSKRDRKALARPARARAGAHRRRGRDVRRRRWPSAAAARSRTSPT